MDLPTLAEAILLSALAFSNVNYSRSKPLQSWMQDCSAEVFFLIKGIDRFPKLGGQVRSGAVLFLPATFECVSYS